MERPGKARHPQAPYPLAGWGSGRQGNPPRQRTEGTDMAKMTPAELKAQLKDQKAALKPLTAALKGAEKIAAAARKDVAKAEALIAKTQAQLDKLA